MAKPTYVIDGATFSTLQEFYEVISIVLIPGEDWGWNLNAFNDILRGGFGTPEGGFVLVWKNSAISQQRLGYFEDLKRSKSEIGPSVFDELVRIILDHGPGGAQAGDGVELLLE